MATLYYNAAVSTSWNTLGNWWMNSTFTVPATALPATGDTVYLARGMTSGPSVAVTLSHIYVADASTGGGNFEVNFTGATGNATFNGRSYNQSAISGNATFNDSSTHYFSGSVSGNATFNHYSLCLQGQVIGEATFNDYSRSSGGPQGNATFNDYSYNGSYISSPIVIFNDYSGNNSIVAGNATFNDYSLNLYYTYSSNTIFNGSAQNRGTVTGNATFNYLTATGGTVTDITGYANGVVQGITKDSTGATITGWVFSSTDNLRTTTGNATFNGTSTNRGTVTGSARFNYLTATSGTVTDITGYANGMVAGLTIDSLGATITAWVFSSTDNLRAVTGNATFQNSSSNSGSVTGNATFRNSSRNLGTVTGNATVYYDSGGGQKPISGTIGGTVIYIGFDVYYNNQTGDHRWDTLGNWWQNSSFTVPATTLPSIGQHVYITSTMYYPPSISVTLNYIYVSLLSNASVNFTGAIANATFSDRARNQGTVSGNAVFNNGAVNNGTVTGNAVFNDYAFNAWGTVSGNAKFNYLTATDGIVTDINGYANGVVGGITKDSVGATITTWIFVSTSNFTTVTGNAVFFGSSENHGTVTGDLYVNGIYYISGEPTPILYFTNTGGDAQWLTLSNWQNHNGDSPKEAPWTGRLTALVNLELSPGAPVPQLDGLLLGTKRDITAICDSLIAEEIVTNGENIISALNLI